MGVLGGCLGLRGGLALRGYRRSEGGGRKRAAWACRVHPPPASSPPISLNYPHGFRCVCALCVPCVLHVLCACVPCVLCGRVTGPCCARWHPEQAEPVAAGGGRHGGHRHSRPGRRGDPAGPSSKVQGGVDGRGACPRGGPAPCPALGPCRHSRYGRQQGAFLIPLPPAPALVTAFHLHGPSPARSLTPLPLHRLSFTLRRCAGMYALRPYVCVVIGAVETLQVSTLLCCAVLCCAVLCCALLYMAWSRWQSAHSPSRGPGDGGGPRGSRWGGLRRWRRCQ